MNQPGWRRGSRCWPSARSRSTIASKPGSSRKPWATPSRVEAKRVMAAAASRPPGRSARRASRRARSAVGRLGEVVERPEQEDDVGAVRRRTAARVRRRRRRRPAARRAARRTRPGPARRAAPPGPRGGPRSPRRPAAARRRPARAADVEHGGGRRGQEARQQLPRAQELEPSPVAQATFLRSAVVVGGDLALVGHGRERSPG